MKSEDFIYEMMKKKKKKPKKNCCVVLILFFKILQGEIERGRKMKIYIL